jgi:ribonucleoside-diphosphate reductase alpha chain
MESLNVIKRDGSVVPVSFDEITERIRKLAQGLEYVNPDLVAQKVCSQLENNMLTSKLDEFAAETAATMQSRHHPNYGYLASRILVSNHHKNTPSTLKECVEQLNVSPEYKKLSELPEFQAMIDYSRDYIFDYFGFKTLERSYLLKNERPQHLWMRVAIQLHGKNFPLVKETYDALSLGYFIHATPTLFNSGTQKPQLSSCFLLKLKEDSIKGIYETLSDCAQISKWAGGIGLNIHNVRGRGSKINGTQGESTGIVPMLKVYNDTAKYVNQGGKRNGSFAIYLEPWHSDIEDFLRLKLNQGSEEERARDLFYSLWIPDLFMKRVEEDSHWTLMCPSQCPGLADCYGQEFEELYEKYECEKKGKRVKATEIWRLVMDSQIQTGMPYLCYKDAANSKSNQKNLGVIKSSNLCVAPETLLLTDNGYFEIKELEGQTVRVWNGDNWSATTIKKTGENQKLIEVYLSNGASLVCTPYHKFLIQDSYHDAKNLKNSTRIEAQNLEEGMNLKKFEAPVCAFTDSSFKYPYTHGFFCGDGTYSNGRPICSLYGEKKKLVEFLNIKSMSGIEDSSGRLNTSLPDDIPQKFEVPINYSLEIRMRWFEGICDSDGSIAKNGTNESIQICSIEFNFLDKIRLMLLTMGVQSKVSKCFDERITTLPDGRGGKKEYNCKPLWRILVSSSSLYKLAELGFSPKRLKFVKREPQRDAEQYVKVVCIVNNERYDDTYCFTEPLNNAGVFNGILTGNCAEIIEYSSSDETAVCNLGSLALPRFIVDGVFNFDLLRKYTKILGKNLDILIDKNYYPTPECAKSNFRNRPIGIGVQGLADVFAILRISWTSEAAKKLNREIFEHIYYAALEASIERCQDMTEYQHLGLTEPGWYPSFQGSPVSKGILQFDMWNQRPITESLDWATLRSKAQKGIRNSLMVALMPTASTSQILGNNECFEPFTSNIYSRRVLAGDFIVINKYLVKDLVERNMWTTDVRTQIIANNGSIQSLECIPSDLKGLYKTVWEIPQKVLIDMSRDRGPFICQSQSLNLFAQEPSYSKLTSMHFYAWKSGLKTGCYYLRTRGVASAQKFTVEPCLTCSS